MARPRATAFGVDAYPNDFAKAAAWTFLHINGIELGEFDVDDAEAFMNDVATGATADIAYITGKLAGYAGRGG